MHTVRGEILEGYNIGKFGEWYVYSQFSKI